MTGLDVHADKAKEARSFGAQHFLNPLTDADKAKAKFDLIINCARSARCRLAAGLRGWEGGTHPGGWEGERWALLRRCYALQERVVRCPILLPTSPAFAWASPSPLATHAAATSRQAPCCRC